MTTNTTVSDKGLHTC